MHPFYLRGDTSLIFVLELGEVGRCKFCSIRLVLEDVVYGFELELGVLVLLMNVVANVFCMFSV